ncbi:AbiV family abortive infection protein [Actinocorallia sp. API 0066]|uniref:AbiV family abortive infection protein n=1 Tax=Actinocorallia sp. API 0066 TaxID=2896846 RepID=UPI001E46A06E|nr:AbiV family abortive infection protein [Actinocorallia sp. API 0066]MCD0450418.1 AbiV family abortive infection protein [Actinocorallia sp. API 0066]
MVEMSPGQAREYWKALMDNATSLLKDSYLLLSAESFGRARSLMVLAQEELGKALWIYDAFEDAWSQGDETPRAVAKLAQHGRSHTKKYFEAAVYSTELDGFWGDHSRTADLGASPEAWDAHFARQHTQAEAAAREANAAKQQGFYVDRDSNGTISSPSAIPAGTTAKDLRVAAQVIEMLLINDHVRMKHTAVTPYDSTHDQQFRLLPISHPEDWEAFVRSRDGGPNDAEAQPSE